MTPTPETNTYKVYLTQEQWAKLAAKDEEVKEAIAKQQPELAARLDVADKEKHEPHRKTHK